MAYLSLWPNSGSAHTLPGKIVGFAQLWTNGSLVLHVAWVQHWGWLHDAHTMHPCCILATCTHPSLSLSFSLSLHMSTLLIPNRSESSPQACCSCIYGLVSLIWLPPHLYFPFVLLVCLAMQKLCSWSLSLTVTWFCGEPGKIGMCLFSASLNLYRSSLLLDIR